MISISVVSRIFVILLLFWLLPVVVSAEPVAADGGARNLRVAIKINEPFVMDRKTHYTGFSVDIWQQLADRLHLKYDLVLYDTTSAQIDAVVNGRADLAFGTISMTSEREARVDFTHSYYDCGLQILVNSNRQVYSLWEVFDPIQLPALFQLLQIGLLFAFIQAHVIYFAERKTNPRFQHGYAKGLWEGFWWMAMIVATGEYGEKDTPHPFKRLVTFSFWMLGAAFIATFTAAVSSNLTLRALSGNINGPDDLRGKRVVTVADSLGARYLSNRGLSFTTVPRIQSGFDLLKHRQVDAVVFDSPVLQYYSSTAGKGTTSVVGPSFAHVPIGIALPKGSPLRKQFNLQILQFFEDGTFDEIDKKWFDNK